MGCHHISRRDLANGVLGDVMAQVPPVSPAGHPARLAALTFLGSRRQAGRLPLKPPRQTVAHASHPTPFLLSQRPIRALSLKWASPDLLLRVMVHSICGMPFPSDLRPSLPSRLPSLMWKVVAVMLAADLRTLGRGKEPAGAADQ
jgi:hypothetical protein